jgi:hypothetical protein
MSIADLNRMLALEARVSALEIVADSRAFCEARQGAGAPADDPLIASVVEALQAGQSIRGAAGVFGLDRNRVFRARRRATRRGAAHCLSPVRRAYASRRTAFSTAVRTRVRARSNINY